MTEKVGRNDPCSCGSGKKYKNCCMQKQQTKSTGLSGRKFTAKVLSAGGVAKQAIDQSSEHAKPVVDYNTLMERSFGDAVKGNREDVPPVPKNPSQYLVQKDESLQS
jgi:uncharacterized protein